MRVFSQLFQSFTDIFLKFIPLQTKLIFDWIDWYLKLSLLFFVHRIEFSYELMRPFQLEWTSEVLSHPLVRSDLSFGHNLMSCLNCLIISWSHGDPLLFEILTEMITNNVTFRVSETPHSFSSSSWRTSNAYLMFWMTSS